METIKITEYYDNPKYYTVMPETVFNALEAAFLNGEEVTFVLKSAFEEMVNSYSK